MLLSPNTLLSPDTLLGDDPVDEEATTAAIDAFRLELGDLDSTRRLYTVAQAQYFLDGRSGNVLLAVADACDALARRFSREHDFEWQGGPNARGKFNRSQMAKAYAEQAKQLRERANGQFSTFSTSRVDGFSDNLDSRAGARSAMAGRVPEIPIEFLDQEAFR